MRSLSRRRLPPTPLVAGGTAVLLVLGVVVYLLVGGNGSSGATRYGASFQARPGESYAAALARTDKTLGHLELVRVFYPKAPQAWPGKAPGRDVVVSFKLDPRQVLAGRYDRQMQEWFDDAPTDVDVYWSYWHEPENDIEDGAFTAAEYKAAFEHLAGLAKQADNSRLRSTVILQSYSTRPASGRDWRDYVPNPDSVDVLAWDVYNRDTTAYSSPADLLDGPRKASESLGRRFAVAELGSALVSGDDGPGRAAWLRSMGDYLTEHNAVFLAYFDFVWNNGADDYRIRDNPSIQAWKHISGD